VRATPASTTSSICRPLSYAPSNLAITVRWISLVPFPDLTDLYISPVPGDRELFHDPVSTMDLDKRD